MMMHAYGTCDGCSTCNPEYWKQFDEQSEAAQDELTEAADLVVIANAAGNPDLYHDAVAALLKVVRQAAKRDALTQARELTDAEFANLAKSCGVSIRTGKQLDSVLRFRALLSASKGKKS